MILKYILRAACLIFILGGFKSFIIESVLSEEGIPEETLKQNGAESVAVESLTEEHPIVALKQTPNITEDVNSTDVKSKNKTLLVSCYVNGTSGFTPVEIVNSTRLLNLLQTESNITNRQTPANCVAVLFYSPSCPFSCAASPHFNALPRIFPDIKMSAVDALIYHNFNAQYGIVGVPTLMLFHNGRPAAKFNDTSEYTLEMFAKFITKYTGIEPKGKLFVTSADFGGPVSSVRTKKTDPLLMLSWGFIVICLLHSFYKSSVFSWLVDISVNTWREAEAQQDHVD